MERGPPARSRRTSRPAATVIGPEARSLRTGGPLSAQPVRAADLPQIAQRTQEVGRLHLRAFDVAPHFDRVLVDRAGHGVASLHFDEAGQDLDVEDPPRKKRT